MKINISDFRKLCIKDFSDNIIDSEKELLKDLIDKSEKFNLEFMELKKIWTDLSFQQSSHIIDIDEGWEKVESAITSDLPIIEKSVSFSDNLYSVFNYKRFKPAIVFGIIAAIIITTFFYLSNFDSENKLNEVITQNGQKLEMRLSDGSKVWLNSGSKISFFEDFEDDRRVVNLQGEAFFSIKKEERPFKVLTKNATTMVIGTQFNVWARGNETRVIVQKGKVKLQENRATRAEVILTGGETSKVLISNPPSEPEKVDVKFAMGWLDGRLIFENRPLGEIIAELERYYDEKIILNSAELNENRMTGTFNNEALDTVLAKICLALELKYDNNNGSYLLKK